MWGAPIGTATSSHSSMARSGSASRRSREVSSCRAAVRMLSCIGRGTNPVIVVVFEALGAITLPCSCVGSHRGYIIRDLFIAEGHGEKHEHQRRECRRIEP